MLIKFKLVLLSFWRDYHLMTRAPILKVYSPQYSTICHLCLKGSEKQRFTCVIVLFLCFSVLLHAGSLKHPLVAASHSDLFYFLFLHSDGYIKWNVIRESLHSSSHFEESEISLKNLHVTSLVDTI